MDKRFSDSVIWLRILMCAFVVYIHIPLGDSPSNWPQTFHHIIRTAFSSVAVPFFFFTSGYFYFVKLRGNITLSFYKEQSIKRLYSLFIPYIIWCSLAICSVILTAYIRLNIGEIDFGQFNNYININYILKSFWNLEQGDQTTSLFNTTLFVHYPLLIPLWFLRDLIVISILSPIIFYFIKKGNVWFLSLVAFLYFGNLLQITGLSAVSLFFFSIGAYCAISKIEISSLCYKYRWITFLLSILMFPIILNSHSDTYLNILVNKILSVTLLMYVFGIAYNIKLENSYMSKLSMASFFIYCFHGLPIYKTSALNITHKFINILIPTPIAFGNIVPLLCWIIEGIGTIFISFAAYKLLKSIFPKLSKLMCGNR